MKLSASELSFYEENGYLLLPNCLSSEEVDYLIQEYPNTIEEGSPRVIREDNGSIRSVFAPHFTTDSYDRLSKLERLVQPSEQLIGNKVYVHQYKINTKKGLEGDWWEWHQDFPYWHIEDGVKQPDLLSVMVFLTDTNATNGALLLIPKSHKIGIAKFADKESSLSVESMNNNNDAIAEYLSSLNSSIKYTVDKDLIKGMVRENGIVTAEGKRGTVLFFHGNIMHASNVNLSPFDRNVAIITYNSVDNLPNTEGDLRPEFLAARAHQPIENIPELI